MTTITTLARPIIRAGRHLTLTVGLLLASLILFIIVSATTEALTGDTSSALVIPWGIATVIAYRVCRHHVF